MKCFAIIASLLPSICQAPSARLIEAPTVQIVEWEHGYKTDYVIATRYRNLMMGFNIGFHFPKHPYNSDRGETFDFIASNGGFIYQGGGYPDAEIRANFKGVIDKETANAKLKEFLPKLDEHIRALR